MNLTFARVVKALLWASLFWIVALSLLIVLTQD